MHSKALSPFIVDEIFPGKNVTTDEDIWKAIQQSAQSWHHAVGTVALGTVLDRNWRVKGLERDSRGGLTGHSSSADVCHPGACIRRGESGG